MRLPRLRICLSIALPNPTGKRRGPLPHPSSIMRPVSQSRPAGRDRFPHRGCPPGQARQSQTRYLIRNRPCPSGRRTGKNVTGNCPRAATVGLAGGWLRRDTANDRRSLHRRPVDLWPGQGGWRSPPVSRGKRGACQDQAESASRSSSIMRASTARRVSGPEWWSIARQSEVSWTVATVPRIVS